MRVLHEIQQVPGRGVFLLVLAAFATVAVGEDGFTELLTESQSGLRGQSDNSRSGTHLGNEHNLLRRRVRRVHQ